MNNETNEDIQKIHEAEHQSNTEAIAEPEKPKFSTTRRVFLVVGSALLVLILLGGAIKLLGNSTSQNLAHMQSEDIAIKLEEKYNEPFSISGLNNSRAVAYPKNDPTLHFEVTINEKENTVSDGYAPRRLGRQAELLFNKVFKQYGVSTESFAIVEPYSAIGPEDDDLATFLTKNDPEIITIVAVAADLDVLWSPSARKEIYSSLTEAFSGIRVIGSLNIVGDDKFAILAPIVREEFQIFDTYRLVNQSNQQVTMEDIKSISINDWGSSL